MSDFADQAQAIEEKLRQISLRTAQQAAAALQTPRTSFICEDCPDEIEPERLAVCPGARRCILCQEADELFRRTHR